MSSTSSGLNFSPCAIPNVKAPSFFPDIEIGKIYALCGVVSLACDASRGIFESSARRSGMYIGFCSSSALPTALPARGTSVPDFNLISFRTSVKCYEPNRVPVIGQKAKAKRVESNNAGQ
jgi:hypothetical protein